jgi:hypothetical protein
MEIKVIQLKKSIIQMKRMNKKKSIIQMKRRNKKKNINKIKFLKNNIFRTTNKFKKKKE